MKIPLLVQADPHKCVSPGVYLPAGKWNIRGNRKSELHLITPDGPLPIHDTMVVEGGCVYTIKVVTPVTEVLTLHAELCQ